VAQGGPRWVDGIVQVAEPHGVIDLGPGHLDPALLPTELLRQAYADAFDDYGPAGLTYGDNQGPLPLREGLAKRITAADGVPCHADQVVITAGTSTTLDLLARWARPSADTVLADELAYDYGMRVFTERGLNDVRVPADAAGMIPAALDEALRRHHTARIAFLYLLPTFHNLTGLVMPHERRTALIKIARKHGLPVVEDDAYADIKFGSPPPTSVAGLAQYQNTIRLGTFSKSLALGLRLGWLATNLTTAADFATSATFSSGGGSTIWPRYRGRPTGIRRLRPPRHAATQAGTQWSQAPDSAPPTACPTASTPRPPSPRLPNAWHRPGRRREVDGRRWGSGLQGSEQVLGRHRPRPLRRELRAERLGRRESGLRVVQHRGQRVTPAQ
jgi:hypothetical protein